jgi:hypothetical protein
LALDTAVSVPYQGDFRCNRIWNGAAAGFGDISSANIMVIAAVFNAESHPGFADPPGNGEFIAHYVDATAAATPGHPGSNLVSPGFSHTVFLEEATSSG